MADADLDVIIRQLAKQQNKSLMVAIKSRRDRHLAMAAKAKDAGAKARYKQMAQDTLLHGTAAAKRLQMSADNAADSYARSLRKAVEEAAAAQTAMIAAAKKAEPVKKPDAAQKKAPKTKTSRKPAKVVKSGKKAKA
jgi:hypothetical protein